MKMFDDMGMMFNINIRSQEVEKSGNQIEKYKNQTPNTFTSTCNNIADIADY